MQNLLFPVEVTDRDLDCRILLACRVVDPGCRVFIGRPDVIHRLGLRLDGGVYFGKHLFRGYLSEQVTREQVADFVRIKERGFTVVQLQDEGPYFAGDEEEWARRLNENLAPTYLRSEDYYCSWGDREADHYRARPESTGPHLITTGHPRLDLYKEPYRNYYADATARIRARYGAFILVNTTTGYANPVDGLRRTFSEQTNYDVSDETGRMRRVRQWAQYGRQLVRSVELVHRIHVDLPDLPIVVRPHPAEDLSLYETVFRGLSSVQVVRQGPVSPWILAARLLIHDVCTTAIEGYLADVPVLGYRPKEASSVSRPLIDLLDVCCRSEDEVMENIAHVLRGEEVGVNAANDPRATAQLANLDHDAFAHLEKVLAEARAAAPSGRANASMAEIRLLCAAGGVSHRIRSELGRLLPELSSRYARVKFPGFDKADIASRMARARSLVGGRFQYDYLGPQMLLVQSA